jgi:hypothetical protein
MKPALALLVVAACGDSGARSPQLLDANATINDSGSSDAPSIPHGLLVSWKAMPPLPGPLKPDLMVTSATFNISRLQVIGDNGQPMTSTPFAIEWSAETFGDPATIAFSSAPGGLYSQVAIEVEPTATASYEIRGTVKVGAITKPFFIHDTADVDIDITGYTIAFAPGTDATLPIKIDLKPPVESVDFAMVQDVSGTLDMGPSDPQMAELRDRLDDAFKRGP